MTAGLRDHSERPINYLRVSVTDRCNLRCVYCMPEDGVATQSHEDILRYEEIERVVRVAARLGISKVRITGGEPLVRAGLPRLVSLLSAVPGVDDLALTTNGILLARYATALAEAGLKRVNVSLDTLRPERFATIARRGALQEVLDGIAAARVANLCPIKVNVVVVRGLNDDEVTDFARLTLVQGWHVRFIELMPLGEARRAPASFVPTAEVRSTIEATLGALEPGPVDESGPARYWRLKGAMGTIGFISPISEHFCHQCNRLRLTADGRLLPCLMGDQEVDLRRALRDGSNDDALLALFRAASASKPTGHSLGTQVPPDRAMVGVGG